MSCFGWSKGVKCMQGLILGIDICEDYCQVGYYDSSTNTTESLEFDEDNGYMLPTVICKLKGVDEWVIGEAAYRNTLCLKGASVDRLLSLCIKNGTSTIEGVKYDSVQLMAYFLEKLILTVIDKLGTKDIEQIVFTTRDSSAAAFKNIEEAMALVNIPIEKVHFATHSESYLYYVISQKPDVYTNMACLFDISDEGFDYYELSITRGRKPQIAEVICHELEEGFNLDILETPQGKKIADKILCSCSERIIGKRVVTSVFLTGRAFDAERWADVFLDVVCRKRRIFIGQGLFAQGAAYIAREHSSKDKLYSYICICNGRITNRIMILADYLGQSRQFTVAEAGTAYREAGINADFILDGSDKIELNISGIKMPWQKKLTIPLEDFPKRLRTTRVNVKVWFEADNIMKVEVTDVGFGEFYPPSGAKVMKEFKL